LLVGSVGVAGLAEVEVAAVVGVLLADAEAWLVAPPGVVTAMLIPGSTGGI
jgi:hypothetical protein